MMLVRPLLLLASKTPYLSQAAQSVAAGVLGVTMLASIAEHAGGAYGEVVVHVAEPDVEVEVGGLSYRVDGRRVPPIVCDLPGGRHRLVVRRGAEVLQDEAFEVDRGGSIVLAAWDARAARTDPGPGGPAR